MIELLELGSGQGWERLQAAVEQALSLGCHEFLYRQVGSALLLPQNLSTVLLNWNIIAHSLAEPPRNRRRHFFS
jgi:hypothetical protein